MRVLVRTADPEQFARLPDLLPPGWRPCAASTVDKAFAIAPGNNGAYDFVRGDAVLTSGLEAELAMTLLEAQVRAFVALHAPTRIFVHAGVVGYRRRAIVLPGMSFAGKTTLVAALLRAGATYYSDEFAPLDEDGYVHPYAKPLSLRDHEHVKHDHDVRSLGATVGDEALAIGAVVATSYAAGAQWQPRRLSRGEGVLALLSHTVAAQTRPKEVMHFLRCAVGDALLIESPRDEADVLAPLLLAAIDADLAEKH